MVPIESLAQNMQVIGNSSRAHACYRASTLAARTGTTSQQDLKICTEALEYDSLRRKDRVATFVNRGIILVAIKNYPAALRDYNRALKMRPQEPATFLNRGNLWLLERKYDDAIRDYNSSLEFGLNQRHIGLLNRGMANEFANNLNTALIDYNAALQERPEWHHAKARAERVKRKIAVIMNQANTLHE